MIIKKMTLNRHRALIISARVCIQNYPQKLHHKLKEVRMKIKLNKKKRESKGKETAKEIKTKNGK